jgi:hypothetical protein
MGAESLLRSRHVQAPRFNRGWILLAALLVSLALFAFAVLVGLISPGLSPESDEVLVGPFRWAHDPQFA